MLPQSITTLAPLFEQVLRAHQEEMAHQAQAGIPTKWYFFPLPNRLRKHQVAKNKRAEIGGLWAAFNFDEAARVYTEQVKKYYGMLHVLGKNESVPLEGVFTDVYIYNRPLALRRFTVEGMQKEFARRAWSEKGVERYDGLKLVQQKDKLFILGQPGAGKTTFLKHVALQTINGAISKIPVFVSLKELADSRLPVMDFIEREFAICHFPESHLYLVQMLRSGHGIVLFDGLDEITEDQERELKLFTQLKNFIREYEASQFLITCRTAATDYQFQQFTYVEMAHFAPEQVNSYVNKWFTHDVKKGQDFLSELEKPEHEGLRELARTPILLTLLCSNFDETLHFPQRRVEIYEEAINTLLKRWDSSRNIKRDEVYRKLSLKRKEQLLARLAFQTYSKGQYFIPKRDLEQQVVTYLQKIPPWEDKVEIDGEAVLKAIEAQHGILVERAQGVYAFAHLTFQEYFVARYIVDNAKTALQDLVHHINESQWREIFLITVSLMDEADFFFDLFITKLNLVILNEPNIISLLDWVKKRMVDHGGMVIDALLQHIFYVFLAVVSSLNHTLVRDFTDALIYARDLSSTLNPSSDLSITLDRVRDFDQALDLVQTHARTLLTALNRTHLHDLSIALLSAGFSDFSIIIEFIQNIIAELDSTLYSNFHSDIPFDFGRARARTRTLERSLQPTSNYIYSLDHISNLFIVIDFILTSCWLWVGLDWQKEFMKRVIGLSEKTGQVSLQQALIGLSVPDQNATRKDREVFAQALSAIAEQERGLIVWKLTQEELEQLANYLAGTELLVECLKLAYVTDRDAIIVQLLRPPDNRN